MLKLQHERFFFAIIYPINLSVILSFLALLRFDHSAIVMAY